MALIKIGSVWTSTNGNLFQVVSVAKAADETWITYKNQRTGEHFSCLSDAFLQRFRSFVNQQY
jgi:hypothetical protein